MSFSFSMCGNVQDVIHSGNRKGIFFSTPRFGLGELRSSEGIERRQRAWWLALRPAFDEIVVGEVRDHVSPEVPGPGIVRVGCDMPCSLEMLEEPQSSRSTKTRTPVPFHDEEL